jgi:hypothetical protein
VDLWERDATMDHAGGHHATEQPSSKAKQQTPERNICLHISTVPLTEHGANQLKEAGPQRAHQPGIVACACYSCLGGLKSC